MFLDSARRDSDKNWGGGGGVEVEPKLLGSRTLDLTIIKHLFLLLLLIISVFISIN